MIADLRLEHQAREVREGERPDDFMAPALLSAFERSHLRDAFVVIKTMQSALICSTYTQHKLHLLVPANELNVVL